MPKRNPFQMWLYSRDLITMARAVGVTKTTIREWRTRRSFPHPLRHEALVEAGNADGFMVREQHMTRPTESK